MKDAEGNPLLMNSSEAQQEVRQSRDLGPDTVDLLGYIDLAKVAEVAKANQMADRRSDVGSLSTGRHFVMPNPVSCSKGHRPNRY